jgi:hypothetical protein
VLAAEPGVRLYQVVERDEGLVVQLVAGDGADRDALSVRVSSRIQKELASAGAAPPQLTVQFVDAIERDPEKMSKLKLVRSDLSRAPIS